MLLFWFIRNKNYGFTKIVVPAKFRQLDVSARILADNRGFSEFLFENTELVKFFGKIHFIPESIPKVYLLSKTF